MSAAEAATPPKGLARRDLLVACGLGSAALLTGIARWGTEGRSAHDLEAIVPARFGSWSRAGVTGVLIPTADVPEGAGYDDVLTRYYVDGAGHMIMFLVAYGKAQAGGAQLHRPEACYPAAGFTLGAAEKVQLQATSALTIDSQAMTATKPGRTEQILYWSRIGTAFPTSSTAQSWSTIRQSLLGDPPDGALVRMSIIDPSPAAARETLKSFARSLLAQQDPDLQKLLTGRR